MVEQVGGFKEYGFDRTVYTIVILTSTPRDGSVNFSYAMSDMNPVNEHGDTVDVYPHRLLFLCPRQANDKTPLPIKRWLDFIEDSFDGRMNENDYQNNNTWQKIMTAIEKRNIDPSLLSEIKDDMAWEEAKKIFEAEGREEGREIGHKIGLEKGLESGRKEGQRKQQQQTIFKARKMGLDDNAISELTGLSLTQMNAIEN